MSNNQQESIERQKERIASISEKIRYGDIKRIAEACNANPLSVGRILNPNTPTTRPTRLRSQIITAAEAYFENQ